MKCARCGAEARRAEARFCTRCGAALPRPAAEPAGVAAVVSPTSTASDRQYPASPVTDAREAQPCDGDRAQAETAISAAAASQPVADETESQPATDRDGPTMAANGRTEPPVDVADLPTRTDLVEARSGLVPETLLPPLADTQPALTIAEEETAHLPALSGRAARQSPDAVDQAPTMVLPTRVAQDAQRAAPPSRQSDAESVTRPRDVAEASAPPAVPRLAAAPAMAKPEPRRGHTARTRRLTRWLVLAGVVLLIAAVVSASILIYQNMTAGGKNLAAMLTYRDPAGHFTLQYPALWTAKPIPDGVEFVDSTGTAEFDVQSLPATHGGVADSYIAAEADKLNLSAPDREQVGGIVWAKRSGLVTTPQGVSNEVVLLAYVRQGRVYLVKEVTPISNYAQENQLAFLPALESFQFR
jgi:hypothetical protein